MSDDIYVVGHRNPDSDSICSAIAYANLKNICGEKAVACRLGPLNEETKFILKRFGLENPLLLKDARSQLSDIELDTPVLLNENATIKEAWDQMLSTGARSIFVLDDEGHLKGLVSTSNLSLVRLLSTEELNSMMAKTSLDQIARTIMGKIVTPARRMRNDGRVFVVTLKDSSTFGEGFKDSICILSDSYRKQRQLVEEGACCLVITCGQEVPLEIRELAEAKGCGIICTKLDTMTAARFIMESIPLKLVMTDNVMMFDKSEYVDDVAAKIAKHRVRTFPVMDNGKVMGVLTRYNVSNYRRKKFVLVDHSAKNQAIPNIEKADICEIIDHHHIGNIETDHPIFYRNMCCGCTASIVSQLYQENGCLPDKQMSGILLSAILSDTVHFKSPTTTEFDKLTATWLAERAGIPNIAEYAEEMLGASVSLRDAEPVAILNRDLKMYEIDKYTIGIGQTNFQTLAQVQAILPEFRVMMENEQKARGVDLLVMVFTHVLAEGSMFVFYGPLSYVMADIIETKFDDNTGYDTQIISRKQQLMPRLSNILKNL